MTDPRDDQNPPPPPPGGGYPLPGDGASGAYVPQQPYGQQPYGQQPYGQQVPFGGQEASGQQPNAYAQPGYGYPPPRTNTLAIIALVLGFVVPIGGIICGHIALGQIKRTGEGGRALALTGLIVGYVFTAFVVLYIIALIAIVLIAASDQDSYYGLASIASTLV